MKKLIKVLLKKLKLYNLIINLIKKYEQKKFRKYGPIFLKKLGEDFQKNNIIYWLEYGTLLGAIREKKIIDHDYDIDIAVPDNEKNLLKIEKIFKNNNFIKSHEILLDGQVTQKTYKKNNISIDVYIFILEKNNSFRTYSYGPLENKTYKETIEILGGLIAYEYKFNYFEIIDYELYNQKFKVPQNYIEHLKEYYGENFMIPNSNWKQEDSQSYLKLEKIGILYK